jgi:hypothetical protein
MAEVLVTFNDLIAAPDGSIYRAQACGREMPDGRWEGWIEFKSTDRSDVLRSARETTQPNRTDTAYWATGLTPVYLEGALARALNPAVAPPAQPVPTPAFDGPMPPIVEPDSLPQTESVLNPFSVYRKGEELLRRQLGALASWHLVNIIESHELSAQSPSALNRMTSAELIELIVASVRERPAENVLDR